MTVETSHAEPAAISRLPDTPKLPPTERLERGVARREIMPRSAHAEWTPTSDRNMLAILEASNQGRTEAFVPMRYGRMLASPFAFYRGAPAVMAYDLGHMPHSGIVAQLCGDCHISNFGMFASPERNLVFDLNDFDETLPGPFEWDLKRTAASIVVAAKYAGLAAKEARSAVRTAVSGYQETIGRFARANYLDTWYSRTEVNALLERVGKKDRKASQIQLARVQEKDRLYAFQKLTELVDGERRIIHAPPLIYRLDKGDAPVRDWLTDLLSAYYESLEDSRRRLLSRYRFVDAAHKVVGVGSVGMRCFVTYWQGTDEGDPLFLQVKQANPSLLEPYLGRSEYERPGRRVVTGQRLMQAANDIFLGYAQADGKDYFIRQLYDMKGSANLEGINADYLTHYAALCGAVLARAHARTGDAAEIEGYLGSSGAFADALAEFGVRYAIQNEADFAELQQAVTDGRITAALDTKKPQKNKRKS